MKTISLKTRAKVNLTLDILKKRTDGYHDVSMIMQSIDLYDTLHFKTINKGIKISSNDVRLPKDNNNLVYKTADAIIREYGITSGIEIFIEKRIPVSAGLAGGSSNAAGTLKALNNLWNLGLEKNKLIELGKQIGSDVPFCLLGGTALAQGTGEILTAIDNRAELNIVLIKPEIEISTAWAYKLVNLARIKSHPDNDKVIVALNRGDVNSLAINLSNVFEDFIFNQYPELSKIKLNMQELGAAGQLMSGSGPTIYGIFADGDKATKAAEVLSTLYKDVFVTKSFHNN